MTIRNTVSRITAAIIVAGLITSIVTSALLALQNTTPGRTEDFVGDAQAPFIVVLGIAQDAGYPQIGCRKQCCAYVWERVPARRNVACLAIVDPGEPTARWLIDATPDIRAQLRMLDTIASVTASPGLDGILLTHGHMGHYTGLMHVGREAMGAQRIPIYAMPRMAGFLSNNGPWDQLVRLQNIVIQPLTADSALRLNKSISITPLLVPHRDEYTETVGFRIQGPNRSVLYIPDIDKWERWDRTIEDEIAAVDIAYLDGTFYADGEIPGRSMAEIPHPFIAESMQRFAALPPAERAKIRFIHLNHTNPALQEGSREYQAIIAAGYKVARQGERVTL